MAILSNEQKTSLGPWLKVIIIALGICAGIAVNTIAGGPKVPVVSEFAAIILGVVVCLVVIRSLTK